MHQLQRYISIEPDFFQVLEGEIGEKITGNLGLFVRCVENIKPSRFISSDLRWCGIGRKMHNREKIFRAFLLKAVHNLGTTKLLIENLKTNSSWRLLCGWDSRSKIPSEATFSRAFTAFAKQELLNAIHKEIIIEELHDRLIGHVSTDSTKIEGREKRCRKNTSRKDLKKKRKRGRKSAAEKAEMEAENTAEVKTRRLALQPFRSLAENLADLPLGCDKSAKRSSKGDTVYWNGYKLHLAVADSGIPLAVILTSASVHDSQVAIPMMQMTAERFRYLYDLMDAAYDASEIKDFSRSLGHIPIIDPNKRRSEAQELPPAEKKRFTIRSSVERANSDLKDNYGANQVRVKGHQKVFCHLMFGVLVLTIKQLYNFFS